MKSYSRCIIPPGLQKQLAQRDCHSRDRDLSCSSDAAQSLMFIPLKCLRDASPRSAQTLQGLFACLCLFSLGVASGCIPSSTTLSTKPQVANEQVTPLIETQDSPKPTTVTIVDRLERTVHFPKTPQRIVSISPETTELLFALGLGERMVGVTEHCDYPPAAKQVAKVGIGTVESISRERIIAVQPDVIFCKWDNHEPLIETFERFQIPIVGMGSENLKGLFEEARLIGKVTGTSDQAEQLVMQMEQRLQRLLQRVPKSTERGRPTVFYQVWDDPLMTVTPGSFIGEVLTLAGLKNIIDEGPNRYPTVNAEVVIANDPDIILTAASRSPATKIEAILKRPGWSQLSAIKHRRVYTISGDEISRCGPRLLDALEQVIQTVYADPD